MKIRTAALAFGAWAIVAVTSDRAFAASKCSGDKTKAAGKKAASKLTCDAKAVTKGTFPVDSTCLAKADVKFSSTVAKAEAKSYLDDGCLTTGDAITVGTRIDQFVDGVASELSGGLFTGCPQPASGQTTAYMADKNDGIPGDVAVADDGTVEAGATLAYVDNGDGTITDLNTGLMWEKKSDDGTLHDYHNLYVWSGDGTQETIWDWLDDVNGEGGTGFAGHNDWRVPNIKELQGVVDHEQGLRIAPAFDTGCAFGCTVTTCSCNEPNTAYWSSTTPQLAAGAACVVSFNFFRDLITGEFKDTPFHIRAVRGGS